MKNIEIELQFPLKNATALKKKLNKIAKAEKKDVYQKDVYYTPAHRDFTAQSPVNEWLRLRRSSKGNSITYKNWHNSSGKTKAVSCDEYETYADNIESLEKILRACDFRPLITVEKSRSTWMYEGVEIAIDEVKGLGSNIEVEAKGEFASISVAKEHLYAMIKKLGAKVGEQDFKGYPKRLLDKRTVESKSRVIEKKTWPDMYADVAAGRKRFDLRLSDWKCKPGDVLLMREWDPKKKIYSGRSVKKRVGYVLKTKDIKFWPEREVKKYGYQVISLE